jgi:predicted ATPase
MTLGPVLWYLGHPDKALQHVKDAMSWAEELRHANTIGLCFLYRCILLQLNGDRAGVLESSERLLTVTARHGLAFNEVFGRLFRGWALDDAEGPRSILAQNEASGQLLGMSAYQCMIVETEVALGRRDAALVDIERALQFAEQTGERFALSTLYRLKGECLANRDTPDAESSEASLRRAISIARSQGAKMLELEAATALTRVLSRSERNEEAHALLAQAYGACSEGHEIRAIEEARKLLQSLAR